MSYVIQIVGGLLGIVAGVGAVHLMYWAENWRERRNRAASLRRRESEALESAQGLRKSIDAGVYDSWPQLREQAEAKYRSLKIRGGDFS